MPAITGGKINHCRKGNSPVPINGRRGHQGRIAPCTPDVDIHPFAEEGIAYAKERKYNKMLRTKENDPIAIIGKPGDNPVSTQEDQDISQSTMKVEETSIDYTFLELRSPKFIYNLPPRCGPSAEFSLSVAVHIPGK
jgi:hypothetical protein